ncbi:FadR/GntR family transcriptional regulator [Brachybacterium alimentarium]|uniref:GntR family transcriptional regulator n=1 Tax=Brachybacterium alimentarium TaxID=47845 RepID=A0A2A3YFG8_9MICO|nr:FCD domain-containing protein [Brachybacterium alimentarium]PCC30760.1 GntR family transcriptional regulator [Brachybacterium alimentarium]PCC38086.1 GntR family transcriptional regulator [Brachybacterium alimentarium]RCS63410.1 FadR family transcriptional regulator [Brachybacterium alimentarium]RCS84680.1 FadR family transcriptional regulator [Brachybacterium alimentarium]
MAQVTRVPLAEQAADLLLDRIREGEWPLGSKLPGESTLGPQLGVGRSTVREAIRRLAGQGVLSTRQGAGVFVDALDIVEDWGVALRKADINSVIEARIAVEVEAAALAAERRSPVELRAIRHAAAERDSQRTEIDAHVDADIAFHRAVVTASHNPLIVDLFDSFTPRSRQAMIELLRLRGTLGSDVDQHAHTAILEAIADHDGQTASALARTHLLTLKME